MRGEQESREGVRVEKERVEIERERDRKRKRETSREGVPAEKKCEKRRESRE